LYLNPDNSIAAHNLTNSGNNFLLYNDNLKKIKSSATYFDGSGIWYVQIK
jgi:hypothetical protein